jgi:hypothetical protein
MTAPVEGPNEPLGFTGDQNLKNQTENDQLKMDQNKYKTSIFGAFKGRGP